MALAYSSEALTSTHRALWWGVIVGGFVVILAVVALLSLLIYFVKIIDRNVVTIGATLVEAEANTKHTDLIEPTAKGVDAVLAEGLEHHLFLGRVLSKVRM
jgi:hypothetical protein